MTTLGAARDKAYTVLMLGEQRNEDTVARSRSACRRFGEAAAHTSVAGRD